MTKSKPRSVIVTGGTGALGRSVVDVFLAAGDRVTVDRRDQRTLFRYGQWTSYQHPMLVMLADLIGLSVRYLDSETNEFIPVEDHREDSDCLDNVTFLLFTRRPG